MGNRMKKYNPAFLSGDELVKSFVVRNAEFERIMEIVRDNTGPTNQHVMLIGPRGIGKTMLALRVAEEIRRDKQLQKKWYPLVFGEESYQVSTPGEFWLEGLFHLAHKTGDVKWDRTYEELRYESDEQRLCERALGQLMDFADAEGKRIMLVVENFNMLLGEQISDTDAWKLRETLSHEKRVMLLATATSRFKEIENTGKAMFELFKLYKLERLELEECGLLWAFITGKEPGDRRVRPLEILTGGNPRLLAIISKFAAKVSLKRLMEDLMQLVDDNTEYFKSYLDRLPPVERKAYLTLVEFWDPVTARQIAKASRLGVSKVSSMMGRLIQKGMVEEADDSGRTKYYQVCERMYNIYHLMRRRGGPSGRARGLVRFMSGFYGPEEMVGLAQQITEEACRLKQGSRRDHFFCYRELLVTAPEGQRQELIKAIPKEFFTMQDMPDSLKRIIARETAKPEKERADATFRKLMKQANEVVTNSKQPKRQEEARRICQGLANVAPKNAKAWLMQGALLHYVLGKYKRAEKAYRRGTQLAPEVDVGWGCLGILFHKNLGQYEEAEEAYRKAIDLGGKDSFLYTKLGQLLHENFDRYEEAEQMYRKALELDEKDAETWAMFGMLVDEKFGRYEEAEEAYRKVIELSEKEAFGWVRLGLLLHEKLERYEEAEEAYRKAIKFAEKDAWIWKQLGELLEDKLERYEEAEQAYRRVTELEPKKDAGWLKLGYVQGRCLEKHEDAKKAFKKATELAPEKIIGWGLLGMINWVMDRYEEAEKMFRKVIELEPNEARGWTSLIGLLIEGLEQPDEAIKVLGHYLERSEVVKGATEVTTEMVVDLAAHDLGREVLEVLAESASAEMLEPLVVGLRLYLGEDVKVAVEIKEVGKDVAERIKERSEQIKDK